MSSTTPAIIFLIIFFLPLFLSIYLLIKNRSIKKKCINEKSTLEREKGELLASQQQLEANHAAELALLRAEYEPLKKYSAVLYADIEASRLKNEANAYSSSVKIEADNYAHNTKREAQNWADLLKNSAQNQIEQAKNEAQQIVAKANTEAQAIAGSALEARDKASLYEKAMIAIRNRIEGYGDEYIVPNQELLLELAEQYGHKEAGVKLKDAQLQIKSMINQHVAATCDYVEEHRRTIAVRFVLDAFNGKVDAALARVRHDNYGKLKQEIEDAYALVNLNGQPFRNARVLPDYLKARINQLEWAVRVHELKQQELEEQRLIREQLREEEKARKEYERAIKEAEKEEKMLQKAMEEAKRHFADASESEKQKYQTELLSLQEKLRQAEEKNQRALSMAQQTRQGHVYIISNIGSFGENIYKIGMTRRLEPLDRIKELGDASVPFNFDVHALIHCNDAPKLEYELHKRFYLNQVNKVNPRKEFFNIGISEIRKAVEDMRIDAVWTMKAEATEYKESLAAKNTGLDVLMMDQQLKEMRQESEMAEVA